MRKLILLLLAVLAFALIHEGAHALTAYFCGEYESFHIKPYGLEVTYNTPVPERQGVHWAIIAGTSNAITIGLGYVLFAIRRSVAAARSVFLRQLGYWVMVVCMILDPFNLAIGPFIYGGDAEGIARGLGISRYVVQAIALGVLLLNRELIVQEVFPLFGVRTSHPLFRPLVPLPGRTRKGPA